MTRLNNRSARIILLLLSSTILAFTSFSLFVLAQAPSPFEISVKPAAEQAVRDQVFTYTVTITNTGVISVKSAFINVDVPDGTEFAGTHYTNLKWYGGGLFSDPEVEVEKVTLFTPEIIEPGEIFTFSMFVQLLPEAGEQVSVESYEIGGVNNEIFTTGTPLETQVVEPSPTPRPTLPPVPTPGVTTTSSPLPIAAVTDVSTGDRNETLTAQTKAATASVPEQEGLQAPSALTSLPLGWLGLFGLILILIIIALGWFLRRP